MQERPSSSRDAPSEAGPRRWGDTFPKRAASGNNAPSSLKNVSVDQIREAWRRGDYRTITWIFATTNGHGPWVKPTDYAVPSPNEHLCSGCVFFAQEYGTCDFDWLSKYVSKKRIPKNCPRGIKKYWKRSYKFFEFALLGEFVKRERMTEAQVHDLFPYLKTREITYLLNKLKGDGKISKLRSATWKADKLFRSRSMKAEKQRNYRDGERVASKGSLVGNDLKSQMEGPARGGLGQVAALDFSEYERGQDVVKCSPGCNELNAGEVGKADGSGLRGAFQMREVLRTPRSTACEDLLGESSCSAGLEMSTNKYEAMRRRLTKKTQPLSDTTASI